jgi:hypothetical protein
MFCCFTLLISLPKGGFWRWPILSFPYGSRAEGASVIYQQKTAFGRTSVGRAFGTPGFLPPFR